MSEMQRRRNGGGKKMENKQALGYMLLACKQLGYTKEQADKLYNAMYEQFDENTEEEAKKMGFNWFNNLPEGSPVKRERKATPQKLTKFPDGYEPKIVKDMYKLRGLIQERGL